MKNFKLLVVFVLLAFTSASYANETLQQVVVADPFLEVHTGHGSSYPVFHVIERGERIEIILRHTSWFKIRNSNNIEGWVAREAMSQTLSLDDTKIEFKQYTRSDFENRKWEISLLGGKLGSANAIALHGAYQLTKILAAEASMGQAVGSTSSSNIFRLSIIMQPFPSLWISPYASLGTGLISTQPKTTLVQPTDNSNQLSHVSLGIRSYLSKRVTLRLEYSDYVIFTAGFDNDTNEDIKEWKAGLTIFF